jgi:hypothetical protein
LPCAVIKWPWHAADIRYAPPARVNIQAPWAAAAVSDGWLRFGGGRVVAVVAGRGFGDDFGL